MCKSTVHFQGFALFESFLPLNLRPCPTVVGLGCCSVPVWFFQSLRWNSVASLVILLFQSSYSIADFSFGVCGPSQCWMQWIVQLAFVWSCPLALGCRGTPPGALVAPLHYEEYLPLSDFCEAAEMMMRALACCGRRASRASVPLLRGRRERRVTRPGQAASGPRS